MKSVYKDDTGTVVGVENKADLIDGKVPNSQSQVPSTVLSGLAKITVGTTEPTNPSVGDLWIDTN